MENTKIDAFEKISKQMCIDKSMKEKEKDRWGVHESHCCPKHGCKYGDDWCPVVLGLTNEHSTHCEMCEYEEDNPYIIDILKAWINVKSLSLYTNRDYVPTEDLVDIISKLETNPKEVVELGRKEGWLK